MRQDVLFQSQNIAFRRVGLHIVKDRNGNACLFQRVCRGFQKPEFAQSLVGHDDHALAQQVPGNISDLRQAAGLQHDGWRCVENEIVHDVQVFRFIGVELWQINLRASARGRPCFR